MQIKFECIKSNEVEVTCKIILSSWQGSTKDVISQLLLAQSNIYFSINITSKKHKTIIYQSYAHWLLNFN